MFLFLGRTNKFEVIKTLLLGGGPSLSIFSKEQFPN